MAIVASDVIHDTKALCLNAAAECRDDIQHLLSIHPEFATTCLFCELRAVLHDELAKRESLLKAMVDLCDALLRERGEA